MFPALIHVLGFQRASLVGFGIRAKNQNKKFPFLTKEQSKTNATIHGCEKVKPLIMIA